MNELICYKYYIPEYVIFVCCYVYKYNIFQYKRSRKDQGLVKTQDVQLRKEPDQIRNTESWISKAFQAWCQRSDTDKLNCQDVCH